MVKKPEVAQQNSSAARVAGLSGIHCVLIALFDRSERVDCSAMAEQIAYVEAQGCRSVNLLGVATEVQKLAFREKLLIIELAARSLSNGSVLSVTVSGNSVAEQAELAAAAVSNGARWLVVQPPTLKDQSRRADPDCPQHNVGSLRVRHSKSRVCCAFHALWQIFASRNSRLRNGLLRN